MFFSRGPPLVHPLRVSTSIFLSRPHNALQNHSSSLVQLLLAALVVKAMEGSTPLSSPLSPLSHFSSSNPLDSPPHSLLSATQVREAIEGFLQGTQMELGNIEA
jgi:hypothetical protein